MTLPSRYPLGQLPTPLIEASRLTRALRGPRILIKRDDLTGFGFGGNKVRGLEFYIADALARNADVIVTGAGPQSNHIRATASAARVAGLDIVAVMHESRPEETQGNLLLDELLGVELRFTDSPDRALVDAQIEETADELRRAGRRPYIVPRGGASSLGALGYVECVREMGAQLEAMGVRPDWLVLATGSCGTQAGLIAGAKIYSAPGRILGVTVSRPVSECVERIERIAREAAALAGHKIDLSPDDILVHDGYIGPGYGIPTPEGIEAIRLVARTEGTFFDPTYTGKGMAGLIGEIRAGRIGAGETVVFLHTGGEPGLFAHPEIVASAE
ncbi:MAG: D-cysteine desulfhydrase family protein [Chloroflexi bacterium]|nr:D-cysteine desulfhydrase family protein [Chloroflexota bacterium]MBI3760824.1 D-cysteine desulfhydrase family protein [Chloroflexota bacterium]